VVPIINDEITDDEMREYVYLHSLEIINPRKDDELLSHNVFDSHRLTNLLEVIILIIDDK